MFTIIDAQGNLKKVDKNYVVQPGERWVNWSVHLSPRLIFESRPSVTSPGRPLPTGSCRARRAPS